MGVNRAALAALARGDLENAIVASTPGGIVAQEAAGQRSFVADTTLPIECLRCTREQLEGMGIVFGEPVDSLFVEAQLPEGWKKVATERSMWSDLVDDRGRKRAAIFYKAAFYDRCAHISLERRFHVRSEPVCGWGSNEFDRATTPFVVVVRDGGEIVWKSGLFDDHSIDWEVEKRCLVEGKDWLDERYPDSQNPLAHWD